MKQSCIWTGRIAEYSASRDARMADHLLAPATGGEKLIVWGATIHGAHTLQLLRPKRIRDRVMGDVVYEALGQAYYVIGVASLGGTLGGVYSKSSRPVAPISPDSLEAVLGSVGKPHAFVNLRDQARGSDWLRQPMVTEILGFHRQGLWSQVFDGVLVIPTTEPVSY